MNMADRQIQALISPAHPLVIKTHCIVFHFHFPVNVLLCFADPDRNIVCLAVLMD